MMLIGVLMLLIVREEDLGTTLLIGATMVAIMFVAGSNPLYMAVIAVAGVGGILYLATHMSERMARLVRSSIWRNTRRARACNNGKR